MKRESPGSRRWMLSHSIHDIGAEYRKGGATPPELIAALIDRIDLEDADLKAFINSAGEIAIRDAESRLQELRDGHDRGPLHGIPIAVKDLIDTSRLPTTYGSKACADHRPMADATVVEKLERAGAVVIGKTNTDPFAFGVTTENEYFGSTRNLLANGRVAGGSSGGSAAAVLAGLASAAIGTDTAGSVRIPAACCGLAGIKPSAGLVSRSGVLPLSRSLDHVGVLAARSEDVLTVLKAISGSDPLDPLTLRGNPPLDGFVPLLPSVRIGIPTRWFWQDIDSHVADTVDRGLNRLKEMGADVAEVDTGDTQRYFEVFSTIGRAEAAYAHRHRWERSGDYSPAFKAFLEDGRRVTTESFIAAQEAREAITAHLESAFQKVDFVLSPTMPVPPPHIATPEVNIGGKTEDTHNALMRLMYPANLAGIPAVSIPGGTTADDLPVGVHIMARRGRDGFALAFASEIESVLAGGQLDDGSDPS